MEDNPQIQPEPNDRKEVYVIIAVGVIFIACICCLLAVAGYALYQDLPTNLFPPESTSVNAADTPSPAIQEEAFNESFNANRNGWTEGFYEDEYGTIDYTINGKYLWTVAADLGVNQKSWATDAPVVEDFTVKVDATHVSGAENASYGLLFRLVDAENLYYFCISDVGYYYVGLLENGVWTTLIDWTETTTVNANSSNTLKVVGKGSQFTFSVNGTEVDSLNEGTHSSGTVGLAIELYDAGDQSMFEFDNFTMESP